MKILLCSHLRLVYTLGASKVYLELGESFKKLGHEVVIIGPQDIDSSGFLDTCSEIDRIIHFPKYLKTYLENSNEKFDVIEFESMYLNPSEVQLDYRPLWVCRSSLLIHRFKSLVLPKRKGLRPFIGRILNTGKRQKEIEFRIKKAEGSFQSSDIISVANHYDIEELINFGHPKEKCQVIHCGLSEARMQQFELLDFNKKFQEPIKIGFVGSFDPRKGELEFPKIIEYIVQHHSQIEFHFFGTDGLYQGKNAILNHFPSHLHSQIFIRPKFEAEDLPQLLEPLQFGIFPSYLENFGIGVLEMLAAGIPVVAYDVAGPPEMLPKEWLVNSGDWKGLANKLIELVDEFKGGRFFANDCRAISQKFLWDQIAEKASVTYENYIKRL